MRRNTSTNYFSYGGNKSTQSSTPKCLSGYFALVTIAENRRCSTRWWLCKIVSPIASNDLQDTKVIWYEPSSDFTDENWHEAPWFASYRNGSPFIGFISSGKIIKSFPRLDQDLFIPQSVLQFLSI